MSTVHSNEASDHLLCVILVLRHPDPTAEGQLISWSWNAWRWSLYLLKLGPRMLIQTCCPSTSCVLVRVSTETMSNEWWGGLQFPLCQGGPTNAGLTNRFDTRVATLNCIYLIYLATTTWLVNISFLPSFELLVLAFLSITVMSQLYYWVCWHLK